ncbi:MAG TPA: MqnA/MqnD/SBP family protein, partial [Thermoanaerobaculia bacterium]|nr:MqnA/MqnD/SBP family protein [Thermoanaerobaculia bacterium]
AALRVDRRRFHTLDLAAAWRELTGLPFVFAVWAVREPCDAAGLAAALRASLETARVEQAALVARAAAELRLDRAEVDHYLRHNLDYELDADKGRSLEMFLACAHGRGLLPAPPGLQTLQPADPALAADG